MVDILVLGATGYTGRAITEYLYNHPQRSSPGFTFAIGARSKAKLDTLVKNLGLSGDVQTWIVDVTNEENIETAIPQARVVLNTVGPFWKWGNAVVECCARNRVHYVDITGEPHFVFNIIQLFDYLANKHDTIIIPACAMDSIPSDVVTYLSNKTLKSTLGPDASIDDSLTGWNISGSISSGTMETVISAFEDVPLSMAVLSSRPYALSTWIKGPPNPHNRLYYTLPYSSPTWYGAYWPMRFMNRQIVQRTWSLFQIAKLNHPSGANLAYGDKFRYDEFMRIPGVLPSITFTIAFGIIVLGLLTAPVRWLVKKNITQSRETPNSGKGFMEVVNVSSSGQTSVRTVLKAKGNPGYDLSSRMVSESALSLVLDFNELPYRAVGGGGILTPMSALGDVLIRRLRKYSQFTIESEVVARGQPERQKLQ